MAIIKNIAHSVSLVYDETIYRHDHVLILKFLVYRIRPLPAISMYVGTIIFKYLNIFKL